MGGKSQIRPELLRRVQGAAPFGTFHEPFVGGGALFFELVRLNWLAGTPVRLSDLNRNLIDAYIGVRDHLDAVMELLDGHDRKHRRLGADHYYATRAAVPETLVGRAARILYLNRTCFNGLYRENSKGEFNVPIGRYENPTILDVPLLTAASAALQTADVTAAPFESVLDAASPGDLVYFDPPYVPVTATSSFTDYAREGFGMAQQEHLADVFSTLARRGVRALLSNSDTPAVRKLYKGWKWDQVKVGRVINSRTDRRGHVAEVIVRNY